MRQPRGMWECPICDATELRDHADQDPPICEDCKDDGGAIVEMQARGPERETIVTDGGSDTYTGGSERGDVVRKENSHGIMKDYVRTDIGTTVVTTPKRINNPVTERTEDLTNLSADGYCRRFLALLSDRTSPDLVDIGNSPILTFDTDRWEYREEGGQHVLVKREAESNFGEMVLEGPDNENTDTDQSGGL